ncbi:hypothetical protein B0H10DRAFT_2220236 [Mycena sp. CBHHK59/15]|nr:hypothetical protein B0H10DRAFT_2220236 [Mycena sp. CBHHK59/15]
MKSVIAPLLFLGSFLGVAVGQLTINTPNQPIVCEPALLTWSGGTPPYIVVRILSCLDCSMHDPTNLILQSIDNGDDHTQQFNSFPGLTNTSLTWIVNQPVGQNLILFIRDNTGLQQNSAAFPVLAGGPTSCLTSSSSSGSSSVATSTSGTSSSVGSTSKSASTSTTPVVTSTSATPSTSVTKPASSASAPSVSASGSPAPSSSAPNAAGPTGVPRGAAAAAALGAVFAALI